jgi:hypothetical protein
MLLRMLVGLGLSSILLAQTDVQTETAGTNDSASTAEYGGPSILSRGLAASVLSRNKDIAFRPHIGINGVCDTGLTGFIIEPNGKLPNQVACGVELAGGVYGYHKWRKSELSLSYDGDYRHYPSLPYYDGTDQMLSLGYKLRTTKHTELVFKENAGTFSRYFGDATGFGFYDPNALATPNSVLFDNRVYFGESSADFTYQPTARLSVDMGATGNLVRYRAAGLFGASAEEVRGDIAYRYSRYGTIGAVYDFTHIGFQHIFGGSDVHAFGITYSLRVSKTVEFRTQIGAARVESLLLELVPVDPRVSIITGQTTGVQATYRLNYVPDARISLTKRMQHATVQLDGARDVMPGNGVYLTSAETTASGSYTYTGVRYWSFSISVGYDEMDALLQSVGRYRSYVAGIGASRQLGKGISGILHLDARRYDTGIIGFQRNMYEATLGFAWSPGDVPLAIF